MILIAHRGNMNGPCFTKENQMDYLRLAIHRGFNVEVDVYYFDGQFWFGHDGPKYKVSYLDILELIPFAWFHLKTPETAVQFSAQYPASKYFIHDKESCVITSTGHIWCHSDFNVLGKKCILVMPELHRIIPVDCYGVCSDTIVNYVVN